jgi:hypothetical protein
MVTGCCILAARISLFAYWQTGWPLTSGMTPLGGSSDAGAGIQSFGSPHRPLWSPSPFCTSAHYPRSDGDW